MERKRSEDETDLRIEYYSQHNNNIPKHKDKCEPSFPVPVKDPDFSWVGVPGSGVARITDTVKMQNILTASEKQKV